MYRELIWILGVCVSVLLGCFFLGELWVVPAISDKKEVQANYHFEYSAKVLALSPHTRKVSLKIWARASEAQYIPTSINSQAIAVYDIRAYNLPVNLKASYSRGCSKLTLANSCLIHFKVLKGRLVKPGRYLIAIDDPTGAVKYNLNLIVHRLLIV